MNYSFFVDGVMDPCLFSLLSLNFDCVIVFLTGDSFRFGGDYFFDSFKIVGDIFLIAVFFLFGVEGRLLEAF